jgi:hypothetical protein
METPNLELARHLVVGELDRHDLGEMGIVRGTSDRLFQEEDGSRP